MMSLRSKGILYVTYSQVIQRKVSLCICMTKIGESGVIVRILWECFPIEWECKNGLTAIL
jgi:hypothetical protein